MAGPRARSSRRAVRSRSARRAAAGRPRRSRRRRRMPITRRSRRRVAEKDGSPRPEPWVAVATAPAIAWVSMSPWLASARPASHSGSPKSPIGVPGSATTRPVAASIRTSRAAPSVRSSVPSVACSGVNEWPAPAQRTLVAPRTAACTSASERGVTTAPGSNDWLPTQLVKRGRGIGCGEDRRRAPSVAARPRAQPVQGQLDHASPGTWVHVAHPPAVLGRDERTAPARHDERRLPANRRPRSSR